MTCGIYLIKNKKTNQLYIGQSNDIKRRWREHCSRRDLASSRVDNAIQKHGKDSFLLQTITELPDNTETLNKHETYWIKFYNSYEDKYHYNLTPGGEISPMKNPEIIEKFFVGENNPMKRTEVVEKVSGKNSYKYRHDIDENISIIINDLFNGISLGKLSKQYNVDSRTLRNRLENHIPEDELKEIIETNRNKALSKARKGKKTTNYENEEDAEKIIEKYRKTMCEKNKNGMCFLKVKKCQECARGFYFQYSFTDIKTKENINISRVSLKQLLKEVVKQGHSPLIVDEEKFSNVVKLDNDLITFTEFKEIISKY